MASCRACRWFLFHSSVFHSTLTAPAGSQSPTSEENIFSFDVLHRRKMASMQSLIGFAAYNYSLLLNAFLRAFPWCVWVVQINYGAMFWKARKSLEPVP
jgi:hypothetical protein